MGRGGDVTGGVAPGYSCSAPTGLAVGALPGTRNAIPYSVLGRDVLKQLPELGASLVGEEGLI